MAGATCFLSAVAVVLLYFGWGYRFRFESSESIRDLLKFAGTAAAVAIAAWGGIYARDWAQANADRDRARFRVLTDRDRKAQAFHILENLDRDDNVSLRIAIREAFHDVHTDLEETKQRLGIDQKEPADEGPRAEWERKRRLRYAVARVLGTFEDLALSIRCGFADESVLYYSLNRPVVELYDMFELYIKQHARKSNTPHAATTYAELEALATCWKNRRPLVPELEAHRNSDGTFPQPDAKTPRWSGYFLSDVLIGDGEGDVIAS
jgi:hypothetical protein